MPSTPSWPTSTVGTSSRTDVLHGRSRDRRRKWASSGSADYASGMLAANVWHWWIGVVLSFVGVATVVAMGAGYVKQVSATRFPGKRQQRGHSEG